MLYGVLQKVTDQLSDFAIWTGAIVGLLKVVDWLLLETHKKWLSEIFETAWIWLSEQRVGKFTALLRSNRTQVVFSIITHLMMISIILAFLARVFWGVSINASLQLGHPRIYTFQVWVDVFALLLSAAVISFTIHPKIAAQIGGAEGLKTYFMRSFKSFIKGFGCIFLLLIIYAPIFYFMSDAPTDQGQDAYASYIEAAFGGKVVVVILHAITAIISAPVLAEVFLLQGILFLSIYWYIFVIILILVFRSCQFILIRVVENNSGPVLALSGFLVGMGAIAKALIA